VSGHIAVLGAGYVGLSTAACLTRFGHSVVCADIDGRKVSRLREGRVDLLEPDLAELTATGLESDRLTFVIDPCHAATGADVVFLCLPTPEGPGGNADLSAVESAVTQIRDVVPSRGVVVIKSTVPVGTADRIATLLDRADVEVVSNPEFLREGSAVHDAMTPARVVIGSSTPEAADRVSALYRLLDVPTVLTDPRSAEMIKYACNAFLAVKLSYVNMLAEMCEHLDADIAAVTRAMGYDERIGPAFLQPGPGWGGPCLPKDAAAFACSASSAGCSVSLLDAAIDTNARQAERITAKIRDAAGGLTDKRIALLGLTFKADTRDVRGSPALPIASLLAATGAEVIGYDPALREGCVLPSVCTVTDPYDAVRGASAIAVITDWPELRLLNWGRVADLMDGSVVVDTRNHLDPQRLRRAGLHCWATGRQHK
jgi:UDPglucose 6-dehydrogenase